MDTDTKVQLTDITHTCRYMHDRCSFLNWDEKQGLRPAYADQITSLYMLRNWHLFGEKIGELGDESKGIKCFAALMSHGKTYIAEVFFMDATEKTFLGTHKVFTVTFPENRYSEMYDNYLVQTLSEKVSG